MSISENYTHATELTGFSDWHQGIERYGFWAVLIDNPDWLNEFSRAQAHVEAFVHPDYQRIPHITLSACGLIDEAHFSSKKLAQQITCIKSLNIQAFDLEMAQLNSFDAAPYISIKSHPSLGFIRRQLESITRDNPATNYQPHLTLGFYQQRYQKTIVNRHLKAFNTRTLPPFQVKRLYYCSYLTADIHGALSLEHFIDLT